MLLVDLNQVLVRFGGYVGIYMVITWYLHSLWNTLEGGELGRSAEFALPRPSILWPEQQRQLSDST